MVKYAWIFATIFALIFSGMTTTEGAKKQEVKPEVVVYIPSQDEMYPLNWTSRTYMLFKRLKETGIDTDVAKVLIDTCKAQAKDPRNCVLVWAMILKAETGGGKRYNKCHNIFSMSGYCFNNRTESITDFVTRYNDRWYKLNKPIHFYSPYASFRPVSRYCASEVSTNSPTSCPAGFRIATTVHVALTK